jgi:hypothetical protein
VPKRAAIEILPQPDDATCGPTCLHAVYRAYGDEIPLEQVIAEVPPLPQGGTLAVLLACHALRRGYRATIYTYNLQIFDPTWFEHGSPTPELREKLQAQARAKRGKLRLEVATSAYMEFFELGGRLRFRELSRRMLREHLAEERPLLVGLSATYLYGCAREVGADVLDYDDVGGFPTGHFVLLHSYDREKRRIWVADPNAENPAFETHHYAVGVDRLIGAIMLGVLTYDANVLLVEPREES